jgi:plastocyanin
MKKMILTVALFALLGSIILTPLMQNADAQYTAEKPLKKETKKTDSKTKSGSTKSSKATVEMTKGSSNESCEKGNKCFSPFQIKITKGETVTWVNKDTSAHTATSGNIKKGPDGKFDTGLLQPGEKFSQKFDKPGSYEYFDMVHPWMKGKVIVG